MRPADKRRKVDFVLSLTKSTIPRELREHGIAAVHPRPFCANEDSHIVGQFDSEYAYANFPKLELQPPHVFASIILDCDSTEGLDDAPSKPWWGGNPTPAPSWMVSQHAPRRRHRDPSLGASTIIESLCLGSTRSTHRRGPQATLSLPLAHR